MKPIRVIIAGAGDRGWQYAQYAALHPEKMEIAGVAEPREFYRRRMAGAFNIPDKYLFTDWKEMADLPKFADAVIIATQDRGHLEPLLAFVEKKYAILLEKPMSVTEEECRKIIRTVREKNILFGLCHVLRYSRYTAEIREMISSGRVGEVLAIQALEPIGYWHFAHSYVRGNWANTSKASPLLLAKSCHDLDWIRCIMGTECKKISSFGSLTYFKKENKPAGASDRCLLCKVEKECAFSALKIYYGRVRNNELEWPVNVITPRVNMENVREALQKGPYGRCVFSCDNDAVDQQVVNMEFSGGKTASFMLSAFNELGGRRVTIMGTKAEITGNGQDIRVFDFLSDRTEIIKTPNTDGKVLGSHGGGDLGMISNFIEAVAKNDPAFLASPEETLESHLMVFAAERSRLENRTVALAAERE